MKRLALTLVLLVSAGLHAQRHAISIEAGPTFGILKKDMSDAAFQHHDFYSLGSGMCTGLSFQYFPDSSNWYFSTGLELYQGSQATTAFAKVNDSSYKANSRSINSLRFNAQLAYSFNIGKLKLDLRAGFLLPLIGSTREFQYIQDSTYNSMSILSIKQYPSYGFKGGLNFNGPLIKSNKLRWFLNLDLSIINAKVKSAEVVYYKDTKGRSLEDMYPGTAFREVVYRKDPTQIRNNQSVLPSAFNKDQATDKLTYTQSLNSVNIKFGFQFLF